MAQLDPSIILQAGKVPMIDPGQLLEQRAQIQLRNLGLQKQQRAEDQAIQAQQTQQQVGQAYASGDGAGARKMALGAGNFDLVGKLDQMDDNGRKRAFELSQATAPLLLSLKKVPPPARAQALQQLAPDLQARGFTPEHIQELMQPGVLSDEYLDSQGVAAQTIAEYNKAHEAYTLGEGQQRFDGDNNLIASGPEKFHAITTPEGGTTTIFGSNGSTGAPGAPQGGGDPASGQRYVNGWSPRARNGGDNSDASVDNYIAHVARTLGVDPNAPLPPSAIPQLAAAMAQFESGGKSNAISNRNNNPGNIKASGGGFQKFDSPQSGLAAQQALLGRYMSRGQNTIKSIIEGVPARAGSNGPLTIHGAPKAGPKPPAGYRWKEDGSLEAIPGGPGDKQGRQANLKPPPAKALTDYQENLSSLQNVNNALSLLDPKNNSPEAQAARNAIGPGTGTLGSLFTQIHDPAGNDFRAQLGRIGGIIIKDTSGAAVSASEDARLSKWVPQASDTVAAARSKLRNLANAIQNNNSAFDDVYNEDNGYRPVKVRGRSPAPASPAPATAGGWGKATVVGH